MEGISLSMVVSHNLYMLLILYKLGGRARIYDIMASSDLSSSTVLYCLHGLIEKKLVSYKHGEYVLTDQGLNVINSLKKLLCDRG